MTLSASVQILVLCLGLCLVKCSAFPRYEVEALMSFKRAIIEDPLTILSNWNPVDSDPCYWFGISCSIAGDHVIKLNISGASLKGFMSPDLYLLSALQELILHRNRLIGTIPKEIGLLKSLKVLDLGSNQLTGQIPPEIGKLTSIVKINLESNVLTGKLPYELGNLKYLEELRLGRNKLVGTIPANNSSKFSTAAHEMYASNGSHMGICSSSQLRVADLSSNFFVGNVPECLHYLPRHSFEGNCLRDKDIKQRPNTQCGSAPAPKSRPRINAKRKPINDGSSRHHMSTRSRPPWLLALEASVGIMVGFIFFIALFTGIRKWKSKPSIVIPWKKSTSIKDYKSIYSDYEALDDVMRFERGELEVACEDFSNIIGFSQESVIYKGTMKDATEIAVLSLCSEEEHWTCYLEIYFQKEVMDLAKIDHENIGKFMGYCRESDPFTRMLVFEYASNGTVHEHLHSDGERCQFSWTRRVKTIIGVARGLKYLHTEHDPPFTISDLKSTSVYLTEDFSPKLVDFESWRFIKLRSEKGLACNSPKSAEQYRMDIQMNIYAFGILLLEIVSGRLTYTKDQGSLADWAKEYLKSSDDIGQLIDPQLKIFGLEDLKVICDVVNKCIQPSSSDTTTSMHELCSMLENGIDLSESAEFRTSSSLAWAELALSYN